MPLPNEPQGRELVLIIERAKYERWLAREVALLLEREFNEIVDLMTSRQFRDLSQFQKQRILQLFREIDRQLKSGYVNVRDLHVREMTGYATLESEVALAKIESIVSAASSPVEVSLGAFLPRHTVRSIAALPIQGLNLGDWFQGQAETMSRETRRVIQKGLLEGKGPADIIRQIIPARGSVAPAVYRRARNEATAITRTTVTAVQNHAAQESYANLPEDVSDSYRYTAIRDSHTTPICRALDGKVYRYNDPKKKVPPQHVGCRSSVVPLVRDASGKFIEPVQTPHSFASYNDWLRAQSGAAQNQILGPTRAEFWRSGKMTLADAIDSDNRVLTLAQLRERLAIKEVAGAP